MSESSPLITVVGSFAVGLTLRADRFPVRGETLIARDFDQGPGGKGSNQAVQAARMGARAEFVGLVGTDSFAGIAWQLYQAEAVGTRFLSATEDRNTGVGFIVLDSAGDNFILLDPGANALFSPADVERARPYLADSRVVITQLEIPLETAACAMSLGRQSGAITILNPAPGQAVPPAMFGSVDVVTPNETELRLMLGRQPDDPADSLDLCAELLRLGAQTVVLTRGEQGALLVRADGTLAVPPVNVNVVDTTGAGDAFSGTLAARLAAGDSLETAARWAAAAGALACTRLGVIPALPRRADVEAILKV
jgi:ribokinase